MLVQFVNWVVGISAKENVFNRIGQSQWNYTLGQQRLAIVGRVITWLTLIIDGEI